MNGTAALKIALFIDRLDYGGSERQFTLLARALRARGHSVVAIVFYPGGAFEPELRGAGVDVRVLHKRSRWDLTFIAQLVRILRQEAPSVLHGYSTVPNILGVLIKPLVGQKMAVIWGVRASNMQLRRYGWLPPVLARIASALSDRPDLIVANSFAGLSEVAGRGYPTGKLMVIPNGIDTDRFAPSAEARIRTRASWNIGPSDRLIGLVGRLDPMKGHPTFFSAAAELACERADVRFICVGDGPPAYRDRLHQLARQLGLVHRLDWKPCQTAMADVYNALDILCSASVYGEGFPNVVGEAMACGVPCVVTNVGDAARVLNQLAFTVPPAEPHALADALRRLLAMPHDQVATLTSAGRNRIVSEFSTGHLAIATEDAIRMIVNDRTG